ncbi:MAG: LysR family transcriptional regulator [Actinobacteria bacterium]|nr:LysR family transcriptional regulator [Actinomycetota bacterium]
MDIKQNWTGVDRRHMAALEAIAEQGSFSAAAQSLGYVQSAVSDQIAYLERCAGLQLVKRRKAAGAGPLTDAGQRLRRHFEAISIQLAAAEAEMAGLREGRAGALRIGVFEAAAERLLPGVLLRLRTAEPGVEVEVVERESERELAQLVGGGEIDVALGTLPLGGGQLRRRQLLRDRYVALVPADWPLARAVEPVDLGELAGLQLIGTHPSPATALLEDELRAAGIEPDFVVRSGRGSVVRAMVAAGVGAALVPRLVAEGAGGRCAVVELERRLSPQTVVAYWRTDRGDRPGLDRFVELASDQATRIAAARVRGPQPEPATVTLIG